TELAPEVVRDELRGAEESIRAVQRAAEHVGAERPRLEGSRLGWKAMCGTSLAGFGSGTQIPGGSQQMGLLARDVEVVELEHHGYTPPPRDRHIGGGMAEQVRHQDDVGLDLEQRALEHPLDDRPPPRTVAVHRPAT